MPKLYSNTSPLVVSQLPDYIRGDYVSYVSGNDTATADYSKFINFVEAYYRFLEKETYPTEVLQNAKEYADVEQTIDNSNVSLVESFFKNYGNDIPRNLLTNNKQFLKFFKDIYKTKGSEEAAKLLFRALYDSDLEFLFPGDYIFKSSDGRWISYKTLLVSPVQNANLFNSINTIITGQNSKATAKVVDVLKILKTNKYFDNNSTPDSTTEFYELYLEDIKGSFRKETVISSYGANVKGVTNYQLVSVDILNSAAGYDLEASVTHDLSVLALSKVNNAGSVKKVSVIESGVYYPASSITTSNHPSFVTVNIGLPNKKIQGNVTVVGKIGTFTSSNNHTLHKDDPVILTFAGNTGSSLNLLSSNVIASKILDDKRFVFYLDTASNTNISANLSYNSTANLKGNLGILKISDGFYLNSKGRASDSYKIQGSLADALDPSILYYQPYSYVLRSKVSTNIWKDVVKSTIHPSGEEVFGDILSINDYELVVSDTGKSEVQDYLGLTADYENKEISADSTTYTYPPTGYKFPLSADHVIYIFKYL